ncbi:beta-alanyl-bioamine nonribosomal peptide synthetase ebony-like [Anabrus simplex]|uniref:beta-alanyl-bioamine nonribosomal peptide synthetase ebony-like n=1 Tax=Anabrus simplex TaxID=316456 RepID=UPI0035A31E4B
MGSIPQQSVLRGETHPLPSREFLLHRLLERRAEETGVGAAPALISGASNEPMTHSRLHMAANRIARVLVRHLLSTGRHANRDGDALVAISMAPSDQLVVTLLAIWKAGAAYLPLDPSFPAQRVAHILNESRPLLVITDCDADYHKFSGCDHVLSYKELQIEASELLSLPLSKSEMFPSAEQCSPIALVFYTSGSTGLPKGVRLPHRVVLNRLCWQWREFPYGPEERVCVFKTAVTFVDSVAELWGPLLQGRAVLVVPKKVTQDPQLLIAVLDQHKVERLVLVPSLLRAILLQLDLAGSTAPLPNLRLWVCSGEPLTLDLVQHFFRKFPQHTLCNFYGSTEIMGDVTYHVMNSPEDVSSSGKVPIGRPLDNTLIYLLDSQYRLVVSGEIGEVFVAGLNLAAGYVNGRDLDRFVPNPLTVDPDYSRLYRTGDYARLENGNLLYEGRTDSQVKVRGHRVDLSEVERAVVAVPGINSAVVLCYRPGEMNQTLLAFVTTKPESSVSATHVESALRKSLASYMLPQVFVLDSIPLLVNGKTDRQLLLKHYESGYHIGSESERVELDYSDVPEKQKDAATTLFETVVSVLGRPARSRLSLSSNFYELGGNSLNSVYTVTKLQDQGYPITITDFISARNMAHVLERMYPLGENEDRNAALLAGENINKYLAEPLKDSHKADVTRIVATSFYEKADLEQWLLPHIHREDYSDLMDKLWDPLVEKNYSFVVKRPEGDIIGVSLNFDAHDEPVVEVHSKLKIVFDFLEYLEGPIRDQKLPQGRRQVLHSFMMCTDECLNYQENIKVVQFMEEEVLRIARSRGFAGIFTTNTNPLTQQLGSDVYKYQVLLDYQVNEYVTPDGSKPFGAAPDWQRAHCSWKTVECDSRATNNNAK